ncbi:hypothetical protein CH063_02118 [Colletotrichum higginsianum]|uniref:Alpha-glucanase n=1 Tax=Colletotrichum higginsianum (strain IMI 349063) TaxID=759273 RepID=H1VGP0_COLHI|nr:Alpha-glucanase [Colletotrichum higginsianum IMI 349063]OBR05027.1 Alpha-glucanase [Colletotrichum higginsianum IMI 349063]CCF39393.1 hypothetical protein CH063_02118 [Colletotrichum higginsianum]
MLPGVAFYEVAVVFVNAMPINLYNNSCVNDGMSWIYYDNIEYISNAVKMGWADAQPAFKKPTHTGHGNSMMESGTPKAMGPSWNICQHYVVTNKIDPTKPVGHGCGFLPDECRSDLESSLTKEWGIRGVEGMCSNFALEHVPLSCQYHSTRHM